MYVVVAVTPSPKFQAYEVIVPYCTVDADASKPVAAPGAAGVDGHVCDRRLIGRDRDALRSLLDRDRSPDRMGRHVDGTTVLSATSSTYAVVPSGVIATAVPNPGVGIGDPGVPVAIAIGTVPPFAVATNAVAPSGVIAIAYGSPATAIGASAVLFRRLIGVTSLWKSSRTRANRRA